MEQHNPYAPPKASLFADAGATNFAPTAADELEYGKFWPRFGAIVLVSNGRKRAVHDFLARTMVVRTD